VSGLWKDRECNVNGLSGPWVYPRSTQSGPHDVKYGNSNNVNTGRHMDNAEYVWRHNVIEGSYVGPWTRQMANKFQFGSPLSETCCKANPHHSQCCGRRRRDAFKSVQSARFIERNTKSYIFLKIWAFSSTLNTELWVLAVILRECPNCGC
jgi:hypothetical protein